jgi:hypothetical protein
MKKFKITTLLLVAIALKIVLSAEECKSGGSSGGTPSSTPYSGPEHLKEVTLGNLTQTPIFTASGVGSLGTPLRNSANAGGCSTTALYGTTNILDILSTSSSASDDVCTATRIKRYNSPNSNSDCWMGYFIAKSIDPKVVFQRTIDFRSCSVDASTNKIWVNLPSSLAMNLELHLYEPCLKTACYSTQSTSKRIEWKFSGSNTIEIAQHEIYVFTGVLSPESTNSVCY